jgi:ribonuclease Z
MELTILGCGSAKPVYPDRNMAAQILNHNDTLYLIDCGEGTQLQILKYGVRMSRIERVFISHLHGDHFLGLPGLISTMGMNSRKEPLTIHAPRDLASWLTEYFRISRFFPEFPIEFEPLPQDSKEPVYQNAVLEVWPIPLVHSIPTTGFLFKEKPKKRKVLAHLLPPDLPFGYFEKLKSGQDIEYEGKTYPNLSVTDAAPPALAYAYCSDTAYCETIIPFIKNVDLLYHEATFSEQHKEKAVEKAHSTAVEAARIALRACAQKLIIGHYSSRYKDCSDLLLEAQSVFAQTEAAVEGLTFKIG